MVHHVGHLLKSGPKLKRLSRFTLVYQKRNRSLTFFLFKFIKSIKTTTYALEFPSHSGKDNQQYEGIFQDFSHFS